MTTKKTVQMIALSGVLAVGVSGHAMAADLTPEPNLTPNDYFEILPNLPADISDERSVAWQNAFGMNVAVIALQDNIDKGVDVEQSTIKRNIALYAKKEYDKKLAQYYPATKKVEAVIEVTTIPSISGGPVAKKIQSISGGPVAKDLPGKQGEPVAKDDIVTFKEEVEVVDDATKEKTLNKVKEEAAAAAGEEITKSLKELAEEKREISAIHNGLAGVNYVFGEDDKFSMSGAVGFHNSANKAFAVGFAGKPADNIMLQASISSTTSRENFGGNVSVSFGW